MDLTINADFDRILPRRKQDLPDFEDIIGQNKLTSPANDEEISAAPGVAAVRTKNGTRIAELAPGAEASNVIRELAVRVPIEAIEPFVDSLEDIFLKAVEADHVALA
jgi:ABC-type uncharacterized transport system ATPase subunit